MKRNKRITKTIGKRFKPADEWLKQARYDFGTAEAMFKTRRYIYAIFMCHLCIEKVLKAHYVKKFNRDPPRVHSLIYLCEETALELKAEHKTFLELLNDLSVPTRYPDELESLLKHFGRGKVKNILVKTKSLLEWLRAELTLP